MKAYPAYKDSGIEWLGGIPEGWDVTNTKRVAIKVTDGSHFSPETQYDGLPYVTVSDVGDKGLDLVHCKRIKEEDFQELEKSGCRPQKGDVLLTKDGTIGKSVVVGEDNNFVILSSIGLIRPNESKILSNFLRYYIISGINIDQMFSYIRGSALTRLTIKLINDLLVVIPPIHIQHPIATYLDQKTQQIDRLIEIKQRQIELLKEQRTAIINQTVTRGLDPNVPMKDSGIEWLGEVPESWTVIRLKYISNVKLSNVDKKSVEGQQEVILCNYTDVYYNEYITDKITFMKATATEEQVENFAIKEGDVIITKDSETPDDIAVPAYVAMDFNCVICGYHLSHIRPDKHTNGNYLFRSFQAQQFQSQFEMNANGITRYGIGKATISNSIFLQPPLQEQTSIATYLDQKTRQIDRLTDSTQIQITQLQEYRTALISAVVTGKIDVRDEV